MRATLVLTTLGLLLIAPLARGQFRPRGPRPAGPSSGFEDVLVAGGIQSPTALAFAPDDRLFVCEKGGRVRVLKNGQLLPAPFAQISVNSFSERGLLGIAFDPNFAAEPYVYVYYTTGPQSKNPPPSPKNRISRLTAEGDTAKAGSEQILLDNIPSDGGNHNAGCLRFGPDGTLYASTGDGGVNHGNSQSLVSLAGKLLRLNRDGSIPPDNPFVGQGNRRGEIWCYGLRNPWRFSFRPGTGTPYIGDVGESTWEEVDVGRAGGNYGWPLYEGPSTDPDVISPLFAYNHGGRGASITGGCFITSSNYPEAVRGSYFFGDYVNSIVRRLQVSPADALLGVFDFAPASSPVDFAQGPDGDLYYLDIQGGAVRKFRYNGGQNRPPVARSGANPVSGPVPLAIQFSSAGSSDADGDPLSFRWDFGDGRTSTQANPNVLFTQPGDLTVGLQVSDSRGGVTDAAPLVVHPGMSAPAVEITAPANEALYSAGDLIGFAGQAIDPEEGALPPERLHWTIVFHHADHTHPFLEFDQVADGSFEVPRAGEASADTWYELRLAARDSDGLEGEASVRIRPRKVFATFLTQPRGLSVTFNGQRHGTPFRVESVVGFDHLVGAPDQKKQRINYSWRSWSDGGAQEHLLRAPSAAFKATATFSRKR